MLQNIYKLANSRKVKMRGLNRFLYVVFIISILTLPLIFASTFQDFLRDLGLGAFIQGEPDSNCVLDGGVHSDSAICEMVRMPECDGYNCPMYSCVYQGCFDRDLQASPTQQIKFYVTDSDANSVGIQGLIDKGQSHHIDFCYNENLFLYWEVYECDEEEQKKIPGLVGDFCIRNSDCDPLLSCYRFKCCFECEEEDLYCVNLGGRIIDSAEWECLGRIVDSKDTGELVPTSVCCIGDTEFIEDECYLSIPIPFVDDPCLITMKTKTYFIWGFWIGFILLVLFILGPYVKVIGGLFGK